MCIFLFYSSKSCFLERFFAYFYFLTTHRVCKERKYYNRMIEKIYIYVLGGVDLVESKKPTLRTNPNFERTQTSNQTKSFWLEVRVRIILPWGNLE